MTTNPMQLLVSVRSALEARAALEGGADIIDAKEPDVGALGPVSLATFEAIVAAVDGRRPVTAALGDAIHEDAVREKARAYASAGAAFVKMGFAGLVDAGQIVALIAAATRGVEHSSTGVVAVAYADYADAGSVSPEMIVIAAGEVGARGVLIDTAIKAGGGLLQWLSLDQLTIWVDGAHERGMLAAVAGRLGQDDVTSVRPCGADIVGVRGAACAGGRVGEISVEKVRSLADALRAPTHRTSSTERLIAASAQNRDRSGLPLLRRRL